MPKMDSLLQTAGKKHLDTYNYKTKANLEFKLSVLSFVFDFDGFLVSLSEFCKNEMCKA